MQLGLSALLVLALAAGPQAPHKPAEKSAPTDAAAKPPAETQAATRAPSSEPPDPDPFGFGTYKGQRPEFMDVSVVNGARMAIAHLISKEPPDVVYDWYKSELQKLGHGLIVGMPKPGMRYVSFRPPGSKKLRTLTLLPHGRGTMILVSVGDPSPLFKPQNGGLDLPMPPGAGPAVSSSMGEGGPNRKHITFEVRGLQPASVRSFYEDELPRRGYRLDELGANKEGGLLVFARGGEQLSLTAIRSTEPNSSRVSVLWIRETP